MEQARANWNDNRLDHLSDQVDALRDRMDDRFDAQDARMERRFDRLQNAMIITLASILAAFGGAIFAVRF